MGYSLAYQPKFYGTSIPEIEVFNFKMAGYPQGGNYSSSGAVKTWDASHKHVAVSRIFEEIDEEIDAAWDQRIERDPDILFGKPVIKGTRLAVDFIIDLLSWGWSESDIIENYPELTQAEIRACLSYAGISLRRCYSLKRETDF
jgi:uncharacterized protein (DUF433 family)